MHDTFVRLSRDGVTATIPLKRLVADPAEDIYARPGDVLTLVRLPQSFSVFGAAARNAEIPFDAATITVSEALAKSQGPPAVNSYRHREALANFAEEKIDRRENIAHI